MNRVTLLIGGNEGNRELLINQATELIRERMGSVVAVSSDHETAPWGTFDEEAPQFFLNRALLVETFLSAHEVLEEALRIEAILGRLRPAAPDAALPGVADLPQRLYHSRPMDVDIIFFNDEVIDTHDLQVPHPRMHLRRFVLEPLAEIMPDYVHPVTGKTVLEMLDKCPATPSGFSKDGGAVCAGVELRSTPACNPTSRMRDLSAEPPQGVNGTQAGVITPVKETNNDIEPPQGVNGIQAGVITPVIDREGTN